MLDVTGMFPFPGYILLSQSPNQEMNFHEGSIMLGYLNLL